MVISRNSLRRVSPQLQKAVISRVNMSPNPATALPSQYFTWFELMKSSQKLLSESDFFAES